MARRTAIAVIAGALLVTAGCAGSPGGPDAATGHRGEVQVVRPGALTATDVAAAQTAFGMDLLHAVCTDRPQENLALSPTSAAEALGLLYPAAGGETADRMADLLHLPSWSPDLIAAVQQHTRALASLAAPAGTDPTADEAPDSLRLSNRLWTATHTRPTPAYLDDLATAFDAGVERLDVAGDPDGATERINAQVGRDTAGRIPEVIDRPLSPTTSAVLTNALHLDASWLSPFASTDREAFATPDGARDVDMMRGATGTARTADGWVSVELPYRDGTLAAVAVLPPAGTDPCGVTSAVLDALSDAPAAPTAVALPALHVEQSHDLRDTLLDLGLPAHGDFAGLGSAGLEITRVVQKTYLVVDERGTEAAAATAVVVTESSSLSALDEVVLDRPFVLLLTDTATGLPLFTAVIHDPSL
ncbi:serpin family protein [Cellulomonas fengjieae]|uniref:Serpin domain-containing protein n=1 Tax=Cellulomonas fengjieae TaxID=2819978 RepID=A0ABS3SJJ4_9CELL|nr:serpin family protein [Cellulomonas fengjieae]MBO3085905.1 hypothetical protein [Cellulomonas fengjieae]QVI67402.1 hypothetical protein KG102_07505 [Cellulomonas fengjieae]